MIATTLGKGCDSCLNFTEHVQQVFSKKCTVVGLGISNLPLIDFLLAHGVCVTARDHKNAEDLGELPATLEKKGVTCFFGVNYLKGLTEDVIFRSPGLRPDVPELAEAVERGAEILSEMELFFELCPARIVGITGSDGKTTTTTLTGKFLTVECKKSGGKTFVGGNNGVPLISCVEDMTEQDFAVLELSSFQLFDLTRSAYRAVITNLSPNHLNWHVDMEEYCRAKTNIFRHAQNVALVTNAENAESLRWAGECSSPVMLFSSSRDADDFPEHTGGSICVRDGWVTVIENGISHPMVRVEDIVLTGRHNLENYMAAIGATFGLVSPESVQEVATTFKGVEHRMEYVRTVDGVRFFNSSIYSTPTRTVAVLSSLGENLVVICGGADKGVGFEPLAKILKERAKIVVLTGRTRQKIYDALMAEDAKMPILMEADFKQAVLLARSQAQWGDTVVLSPACTSFDAFRNFEERGETFRRIVWEFEEHTTE